MIHLTVKTPTDLWLSLGQLFFERYNHRYFLPKLIDTEIAKRRFISLSNFLVVEGWSTKWTGEALYDVVGYSRKGSKMRDLRKKYVFEDELKKMKEVIRLYLKKSKGKGYFATGMNFNMQVTKKGGCLSSFHVIKLDKSWEIVIHGKVAEIPRKFTADMVMISNIIRELELPTETVKVTYMFSTLYFSIISLRAYVAMLGLKKKDFHGLPITDPRNYQVGGWTAIEKYAKTLKRKPAWKDLNLKTGKWTTGSRTNR